MSLPDLIAAHKEISPYKWRVASVFVENSPNKLTVLEDRWAGAGICPVSDEVDGQFIALARNHMPALLRAAEFVEVVAQTRTSPEFWENNGHQQARRSLEGDMDELINCARHIQGGFV